MSKIHPKEIGFDIDGVVADTMEAFIRIAWEEHDTRVLPEEITEFQVENCLDMDDVLVEAIFERLLLDPLGNGLRLMGHAREVLTEFAEAAPLTFITARPQREPIACWLEKELGSSVFAKVRLVATGEHDGKMKHIKDMGLNYFVDDRLKTCMAMPEHGINPIVYSQPWNRGRHGLPEVDSWPAIRALCEED
jgi:uncharacterized HAD superfamily protein